MKEKKPDLVKTVLGVAHCGVGLAAKHCDGCPYADEENCDVKVYNDAKELIKEQNQRILDLRDENETLREEKQRPAAEWLDDTEHWIEGDRNGKSVERVTGDCVDTFRCSWCGYYQYYKTPFCPHCGAVMDKKRGREIDAGQGEGYRSFE